MQRVRLARLAIVGIMGCALLILVFLATLTGSVVRESDRMLDFDLLNRRQPDELEPPGSSAREELCVSIRVVGDASGAQRPQYCVGQQAVRDLAELRTALGSHASQPGGTDVPVIIEASDDAQHGWVIAVIDCLKELRFTNVRIKE